MEIIQWRCDRSIDSQVEQIELFEVVLGVKTKALQEVLIGVHLNQIIGEVGRFRLCLKEKLKMKNK